MPKELNHITADIKYFEWMNINKMLWLVKIKRVLIENIINIEGVKTNKPI